MGPTCAADRRTGDVDSTAVHAPDGPALHWRGSETAQRRSSSARAVLLRRASTGGRPMLPILLAGAPAHAVWYFGNPVITFRVDRPADDYLEGSVVLDKVRVHHCGG